MEVEWSRRAVLALRKRTSFLASKNPRAARDAESTVLAASYKLADFPHIGRRYAKSPDLYRELVVAFGEEGYILLYYGARDRVVISRVKHQREATY